MLSVVGCAAPWARGTPVARETAETLRAVERQHHNVDLIYRAACQDQQIPVSRCAAWTVFSQRFDAMYPMALRLWAGAERTGDTATAQQAREVIMGLRDELSTHATYALEAAEREALRRRGAAPR
jgi:hypothetical protein